MRNFVLIICLIHSVLSSAGSFGSVVFNELMIDPEPSVGLPGVEYIELFNRSGRDLSLKGWTFYYGDKAYAFPSSQIDSAGYCLLCSKSMEKLFTSGGVVAFSAFPILSNTGKQIYLINEKNELVAYLEYGANWYGDAFKSKGGWSLECIDVNNLSGLASNWISSKNAKGGTPGYKNSIASKNPDEVVPFCTGVYVLSPNQLELTFSKSMQPEMLSSVSNYEFSSSAMGIVSAVSDFPGGRSVLLNIGDSLVRGEIYHLKLKNLTDVSSFGLNNPEFSLGLPVDPCLSDLSMNEVLFNPVPNGFDYIEFVNISDKCIDLSKVWLTNKSESGAINAGVRLSEKPRPCMPGTYWLLSANVDSVALVNGCPVITNAINLASFPSMPDVSGNVMLVTASAQVIDEMAYKENMHVPLISNAEGASLEKINPALPSLDRESWTTASQASGYGTPGFQNSQYRDLTDLKEDGFFVEKKWMTPNNDGKDDCISISYLFSQSGMSDLVIYDLTGKAIRHLLKNELLGAKGTVFWDGTADDGGLVPFGRYILHANYLSPFGKRNKKSFVLTVLF